MTKPTKEDKLNIISWEVMGHEWSGMQQVMIGDCLKWIQDQPNVDKFICKECGKECEVEGPYGTTRKYDIYCKDDDCGCTDYIYLHEERYTLLENRTDPSLPIDDNEEAIDMMYNLVVNYKNGKDNL